MRLGRDVSANAGGRGNKGTHSFSELVLTMYSARLTCGFHWTSATFHVPPCGRKRGTLKGDSRSMMKSPRRAARTMSREVGEMDICRINNKKRKEKIKSEYIELRGGREDSTHIPHRIPHKGLHIDLHPYAKVASVL